MSAPTTERVLTGWGRTAPSGARVVRPDGPREVAKLLTHRPVIARGLGRSYGDAAQRAGGVVVDTSGMASIGPIDARTGTVTVGGGAPLGELMRRALVTGWFVGVTPGTRHVTVGGAIAADVHGKNHHRDGGFCRYVTNLTLATPTGVYVVGPDDDPELFWATAGGMGLTGVITEATLQLVAVESSWMAVDTARFDRLDDVMAAMSASDADHRYSVAWVDVAARPGRRGRSVLTRGDHAPRDVLPSTRRTGRPGIGRERPYRLPSRPTGRLLTPELVRAMNSVWFRKAPRQESGALQTVSSFFHPLDRLADWNVLYGRRGFVQYQFVVGSRHADLVHRAIAMTESYRVPSFLAVLKRLGPGDPGPLSFPVEGWTLALDFPVGPERAPRAARPARRAGRRGGRRVYLAKDSRLRLELLPVMYPRLAELADVRRKVDPERVIQSDLSRRLGLDRGQSS